MSLFTPVQGIVGGSLIGGSAGVLLILNGDIMGASGILSNALVNPIQAIQNPKNHWRYVYLASFALSVNVFVNYLAPKDFMSDERSLDSDVPIPSAIAYILGGFFVGLGTKIGNGCTTGHGICGISRFSPRNLVATCTFTGCSMATTYFLSPLRQWGSMTEFLRTTGIPAMSSVGSGLFLAAAVFAALATPAFSAKNRSATLDQAQGENEDRKTLGATLSGAMFAAGLAISGMAKASKVHDFLCISGFSKGSFDPTLVAVMGCGILASWLSYQFVDGFSMTSKTPLTCPLMGDKFSVPTNTAIDSQLLLGTSLFGLGWGITGICPGPAIFAAASGNVYATLLWLPGFVVGSMAGANVKEAMNSKKKAA
ncbi:YeeE YedE family integral membrane protein [Seminavis robusta]|uniref:YeeE YedE family integral membrane protein n=1 Tax=Seminavis robusta TaxID=568900 RepID=A0A9N8EY67_9STRA|nr:YeeE YedE family integral membrane protein [Seminavis robusta]|eukprot:Sro1954_g307640.1 YeeE YedE family integral membrane protein (368) ;mRNA; f:10235-11651